MKPMSARRVGISFHQPYVESNAAAESSSRRKTTKKATPPKRLGFNWGGWNDGRFVKESWRESLGWPWSGGGALGWPVSGGGPLGWPWSGGGALGRRSVGLGYHPDMPDRRDYCLNNPKIIDDDIEAVLASIKEKNAINALRAAEKSRAKRAVAAEAKKFSSALLHETKPAKRHDLRWTGSFSPVEDQGEVGSCTAQAIVGLVEYLLREGEGDAFDMSRMFLYKATRNLLGWEGDTGAYIRTTIKAMALFGVPPEHEWPYDEGQFDEEPGAYHYSFAQNFKALTYARLDGYANGDVLDTVKRALFDGFPVAFGFPVYDSISNVGPSNAVVPFPTRADRLLGGHAVLAVGYDDEVEDPRSGDKGALIFRNSWSTSWGEVGYGYLPYTYVEQQLAEDFWTIFNREWMRTNSFD